ncbi:hypothetical protein ACERK3_10690 [Phycisphaerales bacterium AB-hyl4]|uniref:Uncharacterized protein n=1 Tax=Natronomicrosphaera hydrolytica TaxID=3242702 RepID=A0ABV4U905_9BACT
MDLSRMNAGLGALVAKYPVGEAGELIAQPDQEAGVPVALRQADGQIASLLPWRVERRFVELRNIVEGGTLESLSTLRFAWMRADTPLQRLLYRELDLCTFLGGSPPVEVFSVMAGSSVVNVIVRLADGKIASLECSNRLPAGSGDLDRHELIARRGIACDRVVDTQVPQSSIYVFAGEGERRFQDDDMELYDLPADERRLVRAAFHLLQQPKYVDQWNQIHVALERAVSGVVESADTGRRVELKEVAV